MFFVDKYSPKTIDDATIHKNELKKLLRMSKDESIPHTIFFGPEGCGKKTVISQYLEMIFGESVHKTCDSVFNVTGSGNNSKQISIKQSHYHIVIEPTNTNFDRYLIQDVVKEYAKRAPHVFVKNKSFRVVLINNIDNMSYYAQTSLRRTMELYSHKCRFIMWSRSLSKVIEPLRSRCYCFRLKAPTNTDMMEILADISAKENILMTCDDFDEIIKLVNGNIKKALWLLSLKKINDEVDEDKKLDNPYFTSYDEVIGKIIEHILDVDVNNLKHIRLFMYTIMITNISGTQIIKDVVNKLMNNDGISDKSKINISEISAKYEHNLIRGRREIIHLEACINGIIYVLAEEEGFIDKDDIMYDLKEE
jgi:replication factor C subunit 3/5